MAEKDIKRMKGFWNRREKLRNLHFVHQLLIDWLFILLKKLSYNKVHVNNENGGSLQGYPLDRIRDKVDSPNS